LLDCLHWRQLLGCLLPSVVSQNFSSQLLIGRLNLAIDSLECQEVKVLYNP